MAEDSDSVGGLGIEVATANVSVHTISKKKAKDTESQNVLCLLTSYMNCAHVSHFMLHSTVCASHAQTKS